MTDAITDQLLRETASALVDVTAQGGVLNDDLYRRMAIDVERDGVTYHIVVTVEDAESQWEASLSTDDKVALILHTLGHHTDMIQVLGQQGGQTHHLVHEVADAVGAVHG